MKKLKIFLAMVITVIMSSSCSTTGSETKSDGENEPDDEKAAIWVTDEGYPITIRDYLNEEVTLDNPPVRVAVLSGTPLNIWYDLGGKSVCTSEVSSNLKLIPEYAEEIRSLPSIGPVYSVNIEAIIAQNPDFVIAQTGTQGVQAARLREMGYSVINTYIRSFDEVIDTYRAFGRILEAEELAEQKVTELTEKKEELVSKAPENGKTVVILYLTGSSLSVKLNNSIAGDVALMLGLTNIASNLPPDTIGSENTPLDIEFIVGQNPDMVLVTSMIASNQVAIETMEKIFAENPVWQGVEAVVDGRIAYLPQEYFLYNAGPYFCEAIEYMARSVYPEIYGEAGDMFE